MRFRPPYGYRIGPGEAPELVAEVERLRRETGAPRLEASLIDADFNAAGASVPRVSGLFGHRHCLVLGLPLMRLLSREQMLAVIAHELGHFGGGHSRFSGWIYRVRVSWYRVLGPLSESGSSVSRVYTRFFHWYATSFNAYSFALARANEYQADAAAARVMGAPAADAALIRIHLGGERLQRDVWPQVRLSHQTLAVPPTLLSRNMALHLRSAGVTCSRGYLMRKKDRRAPRSGHSGYREHTPVCGRQVGRRWLATSPLRFRLCSCPVSVPMQ